MKRTITCFLVSIVLLVSSNAYAGDPLGDVYEKALIPAKFALTYDECVRKGLLQNTGQTAEDKLRRYFDRSRGQDDAYRKDGITGKQVAETANKAVDEMGKKMIEQPPSLDEGQCQLIQQQWPAFAERYGFQ